MATESNTPTQQQRQFVRIEDVLPFSWRRISEAELNEVVEHFEKNHAFPVRSENVDQILSSLEISGGLRELERSDPNLAKVLGKIDQKLNILIRLFQSDEEQKPLAPTPVNLSGGGIAIWERESTLAIGDILEVRLSLSRDALMVIHAYARVMNIFENDRDGMNRIACKYDPILDNDRERLIQYIFQRQTEMIRRKRSR
ncbi:MAG: PilZ domain-containing protein [Magnetococcales bacterium]|nr:PilZ domain-containing protein [Magnetococcales bacterium]